MECTWPFSFSLAGRASCPMPVFPIIFALAMCITPTMVSADEGGAEPASYFERTEADFGEVTKGSVVSEVFPIKNTGQATLRVERVELSSGGMKIAVKQDIEPGTTENARISWDTSSFAGDAVGQVLLYMNDPRRPRVALTLEGRVLADVEIIPRPAFYLSQFVGQESIESVVLRNNREQPLEILGLERQGEHFEAGFDVVEPGRSYRLVVTVPPETLPGRYRESMTVLTDDPQNRRINVEVNVLVKTPVFANPEALDFGTVSLRALRDRPETLELLKQSCMVVRQAGVMRITSVTVNVPFLLVETQPNEPSNRFRLDVSIDPRSLAPGDFEGVVNVHTDDLKFPELNIPVRGSLTQ